MTATFSGLGNWNYHSLSLFDLEFQKDRSIVQFEIEDVFESKDGCIFPEVNKFTKIENLPDALFA